MIRTSLAATGLFTAALSLSKVLVRVVLTQLKNYLTGNDFYDRYQSAYREHHSTEALLLRVHDDLLRSLDAGDCVALLLLDLSSAFDTVSHSILLRRLHDVGIRGIALQWFESYLTNRKQTVQIGSSLSAEVCLQSGVPQGSVLRPVLFCLYLLSMSRILQTSSVRYHIFADDTQLYLSLKKTEATCRLHELRILQTF